MRLQPITYRGQAVAAATPERFFLADELRSRPPGDPETVFVCYMCAYAREVLTDELPGPYTEHNARRFARAALIPGELLERDHLNTRRVAGALKIPERELTAALAEAQSSRGHGAAAGAALAAAASAVSRSVRKPARLSASTHARKRARELAAWRACCPASLISS